MGSKSEFQFVHRGLHHARTKRSVPHTRQLKADPLVRIVFYLMQNLSDVNALLVYVLANIPTQRYAKRFGNIFLPTIGKICHSTKWVPS